MKPDLDVAATLECEPELLPFLPEILQDFDALGSNPPRLIELLETQGVADQIRTGLDICSGKGATSIALAKRFGMHIDGIDAIGAFVESARAAATNAGVDELCRFTTGDLAVLQQEVLQVSDRYRDLRAEQGTRWRVVGHRFDEGPVGSQHWDQPDGRDRGRHLGEIGKIHGTQRTASSAE